MLKQKRNPILMIISALLLMSVILSACGTKDNNAAQANNSKGDSNLLEQVKAAGVLKVGMMGTYPPYNFLNDKKEMDGFDADIAKEIAKRLGVKVEFVAQEFSGMIAGLQAKKFDAVISQMTITPDRQKQMDFTEPYITNEVRIIVRDDNNSITKLEDFKGKKIGVGLGTNDEAYLRNEVLPKVGNFEIKTYDDVNTSLQDLNSGRIDATINNIYALKPIIEKNGFKIKAVGEAIKADKAGIAVRKGNPEFRDALDKALKDMKADGTYNAIFKKWFGEEPAK
ncbi:transporter substrate-binding domain-containing protein [Paenibacillus sediminis]|uniref:Cystine transport system substrate-binding protein n=1 Tax=Paenibacillus sediminis TaxID=664909 RepID=A0ABS4GY84_9BACL|nr:transporter substrate-binding domain-containing protein [Paenibacillus sediminis]MBP1935229.1 cystine transport system substrate-binding protein [Paenibacillus sediminis]